MLWHAHTLRGRCKLYIWRFLPIMSELAASNAKYVIEHSLGEIIKFIDWTASVRGWESLEEYIFEDHPDQGVWLSDAADGYLIADAMKIESISGAYADPNVNELADKRHAEVYP